MRSAALTSVLLLALTVGGGEAASAQAATYSVGTTSDLTGTCANPAGGGCSLRQLIDYENALATTPNPHDVISVPAGTYPLSNGELTITQSLTIMGAGARTTHVAVPAGVPGARVFDIQVPEEGTAPTVTIAGLEISGGFAGENNGFFGGDVLNAGSLVLDEDWVTEGNASSGGGISNNTGTLLLERSLVSDNHASGGGGDSGGIQNHGSEFCGAACFAGKKAILTVEDSTIAENDARLGAGIFSWSDASDGNEVTIVNSTIADNVTENEPGGAARGPGAGLLVSDGTAHVTGSILAFNDEVAEEEFTATNCSTIEPGTIVSLGYNLENGTDCGFNATGDLHEAFPEFSSGALQDNGGNTNTLAPDATSPAVDAIPTSNSHCSGTDQRGIARPQGAGCDIGAVEIVPLTIQATEGAQFSGEVVTSSNCSIFPNPAPTITWGDGQSSTGTLTETGISGTHVYAKAGTYNGTVTYTNDCGSHKVAFQAKVADAPLTAAGVAVTAAAGTSFSGKVATFTDADPGGVVSDYTATITWGDGSSSVGSIAVNSGGGFAVSGSHTYAAGGVFKTSVAIKDVGGSTATVTSSATVSFAIAATEGTQFSGRLVTSSCTISGTASIEWGDGQTSAGTVDATHSFINGTHTYAKAGTYSGVVVFSDGCGSHKVAFQATVADAPLTAAGVAVTATAGTSFSGKVATFTDADPGGVVADYTATIEWGDGSSSAGTIAVNSGGGFAVSGSHTYAAGGVFKTSVAIKDVGGSTATVTSSATVSFAIAATEGAAFSGRLVTSSCTISGSASIEWGDGQTSAGTVDATHSFINGSHTYAKAGTYSGVVIFTDGCGSHKVTFQAKVADAPLTAAGVAVTAAAGSSFSGKVATFTDADPGGVVSDYTATIEWGDGSSSAGTVAVNSGGGFAVSGSHTYTAGGVFKTNVAIKDVGGATVTATSSATVSFTIAATEGAAFSGRLVTSGCTISGSASIEWGDGQTSAGTVDATHSFINGSHTYAKAGTYSGTVVFSDGCGSHKVTFQAKVADAPLTATGVAVSAADNVAFNGKVATFTDADPGGVVADYTATIEWGDGSSSAGTVAVNSGGGFAVSGSHTYTADGVFKTSVTIKDVGGATVTATSSATVSFGIAATEGTQFSGRLVTSGCTISGSASIEWGDGQTSAGTVDATHSFINGTHTYAKAGTYGGVVIFTDGCGSHRVTFQAIVADAPLTAAGVAVTAAAGSSFSGKVATFTDADPGGVVADYTATIEWGDGSSSAGTIAVNSGGGFAVSGSHTYAAGGVFKTSIAIEDVGGSTATATSSATVSFGIAATEGAQFSGRLVTSSCTISGSASIEWGDGQTSAGTVDSTHSFVNGTHTYAKAGKYNGTVVFTDGCGSHKVAFQATVADAPLTAAGVAVTAAAGTSFSGKVATFTDADPGGVVADYTATIEWGDGSSSAGTIAVNSGGGFAVSGSHTYAAGGVFKTSVAIKDVGGSTVTATSSATVSFSIAATEGAAFSGRMVTSSCTISGAASIEWGDGQTSAGTVDATHSFINGSHTYAKAGTYNGTVVFTDGCGSHKVAFQAKVADAPLTAAGVAVTAAAGTSFSGKVATFTDADPGGVVSDYTATIEWGDGSSSAGTIAVNSGGGFAVSGSHTYAAGGVYKTSIAIKDVGGSTATATSNATVSFAIAATEGAAFSGRLVTSSCTISGTASIAWGDGQTSAGTVDATHSFINGSHTYAKAGTYGGVVTFTDGCGSHKVAFQAKVADAPLSATGVAVTATATVSFNGKVATFTDADPGGVVADYTASIDWGDGSADSAGTISAVSGGGFAVSSSHTYATDGTYKTSVAIKDVGGSTATATSTATVGKPSGPPLVSNVSVTSVTVTTATIAFTVNPDGADTSYVIEYGPDAGYGQKTEPVDIGATNAPQQLTRTLTGLEPNKTYHFDVLAVNSDAPGGVGGGDQPFTTATIQPPPGNQLGQQGVAGFQGVGKAAATLATLPPPVLGKTVNVEPVSGIVLIALPPTGHTSDLGQPGRARESLSLSKGLKFIPLTEARQIPVGSILNTTAGIARIVTATATQSKLQQGDFGAGLFKLLQSRKQRGLTELDVIDAHSARQVCATLGKKAVVAKHLSSKVLGRLSASSHGKFTGRGDYSAATVRGTVWTMADQCNGTLTHVKRGVVSVRDFRRRKTITLFTGQSYLAKAR